jgi:hypothetical protein
MKYYVKKLSDLNERETVIVNDFIRGNPEFCERIWNRLKRTGEDMNTFLEKGGEVVLSKREAISITFFGWR